jgi:hypothetical protein
MILTLILLFGLASPAAHAQNINKCQQAVQTTSAREHTLFRSILFGEPKAEDAPIGHIITAGDGSNWIKTEENTWRSVADGYEDTTWRDILTERQKIAPTRKGIFATKRMLTSELVPAITDAVRTFDCRLRYICKNVELAAQGQETPITASVVGCTEHELVPIDACMPSAIEGVSTTEVTDALTYCTALTTELLKRETELLALTVEYDAAYRSTLQLAGDLDGFLTQLRWPMTNTIQKVANIIGSVARVPCFTASCDDYPLQHPSE